MRGAPPSGVGTKCWNQSTRSVERSRPCDEEVSQRGSPSEWNAAPALPIRSIKSSSSRADTDQAQRQRKCELFHKRLACFAPASRFPARRAEPWSNDLESEYQ